MIAAGTNTVQNISQGWIRLYRLVLDSGLIRKHKLFVFWSYCHLKATYKPYTAIIGKQSIELLPGQFIFGRYEASEQTGLTISEVRTCLATLIRKGELTVQPTTKYSIITIVNWAVTQGKKKQLTTYNEVLLVKENIKDSLLILNIDSKDKSGQITVKCPYCDDKKRHLYIDPLKEVFYCHKCGEKGRWSKLYTKLSPSLNSPAETFTPKITTNVSGIATDNNKYSHPSTGYIEQCHKKLMGLSGTKALEYLTDREITLQAIKEFKLGLKKKSGTDQLVIPHFKNGNSVNAKYRTLPPAEKKFHRWDNGESILFNQDCLERIDGDEVILLEGELDLIALYSQGYRNVVSTTIGANGFKPEWVVLLKGFNHILIVYDSDKAGQEGAKKVAKLLGLDRCRNVLLPTKDVNDFFMAGHTNADFKQLIEQAVSFESMPW